MRHPLNCHVCAPARMQTTRSHSPADSREGLSMKRNRIARPLILCVRTTSWGFSGDFYIGGGIGSHFPHHLARHILALVHELLHVVHRDHVASRRRSNHDDRLHAVVPRSLRCLREETFFRIDRHGRHICVRSPCPNAYSYDHSSLLLYVPLTCRLVESDQSTSRCKVTHLTASVKEDFPFTAIILERISYTFSFPRIVRRRL